MVIDVFGDRSRKNDLARPLAGRSDRHVLFLLREIAVERGYDDRGADPSLQALGDPADFSLSWKEGEDGTFFRSERIHNCGGHGVLDPLAPRPIAVADLDRETASFADYGGWAAEECGYTLDIERRRHDEKLEIRPECELRVERQRQTEIGIQRALVEFVEDHGRNALQFRILENHSRKDPFSDHLNTRSGRDPVVEAHAIADGLADGLTKQRGHATGGGTGGKPARLQQDDLAVMAPGPVEKIERHDRRLAGPRRCGKNGSIAVIESQAYGGQYLRNGKLW